MKILVVEDESKIGDFLKKGLADEGYAPWLAPDAESALSLVERDAFDCFIVDIMLPGMDGIELCRVLRSRGITAPILILTARGGVSDKVAGLDAGADDYLTKPFSFDELTARIRALIRKGTGYQKTQIEIGDLTVDPATRTVQRAGDSIELSKKEEQLLIYLAQNRDRVVTRTMISKAVWENDGITFTNIIDVFITHLRKKIDAGHPVKLIHTVRGHGFTLSEKSPLE